MDQPQHSSSSSRQLSSSHNTGHSCCHHCECHSNHASPSPSASPHSASLPSPPDSPPLDPYADIDLDSVSSFPSISSSVFFSSSAGSPHSQPRIPEHEHDGLIIPSLTLPDQLQQPTPYGQTLGDMAFLLAGPSGGGKTSLAEFLAGPDDIVDVADWEDTDGGRILRASTYWLEDHDPHGLERFEGAGNVSFTELDGFDPTENPKKHVAERILKNIHTVFVDLRNQIDSSPSSTLLHSLLASSNSPLYTALIYVIATPLTNQDRDIISILSSSIPVILFCTTSLSSAFASIALGPSPPPKLATFQPHSQLSLRTGLFRSPQTISALRAEAADRFMRWREAERAIENITTLPSQQADNLKHHTSAGYRRPTVTQYSADNEKIERWNKATWEAMLSEDVARRLRQMKTAESSEDLHYSLSHIVLFSTTPSFAPALDPLQLRSLMLLSLSLFAPRSSSKRVRRLEEKDTCMEETRSTVRPRYSRSRSRSKREHDSKAERWRFWRWGLAIFCAGIGIGCMLSTVA